MARVTKPQLVRSFITLFKASTSAALLAVALVSCGSDSSPKAADTGPGASTTTTTVPIAQDPGPATLPPVNPEPGTMLLAEYDVAAGSTFRLRFGGDLVRIRGGYYWLTNDKEEVVALLRSDGNPGVAMSVETDRSKFAMLDDGLSGSGPNTLQLPEKLKPGTYTLCTANSPSKACIPIPVKSK